ncbi:hypothetical protein Pyrde_0862 [Pyrodictium delaneyi]|uniref:Uncharacterized protein n=1 Tax=Pyrodictium delaneyi TaxID=1273541 RepID=A0A0P0N457_9CREN|nr:hypothetical protein [Pyrodictium delaneyi]ALL00912.1 hypothetical protein Pyrde_0862 [Pyrodictium delaneyi]OWJ55470.1 hypothetical protein Pdsh_01340 [Pyrodictium delaneyi]
MPLVESYHEVCRTLGKLCPRLVPSPLWGISLAKLARADPWLIDDAFCNGTGRCAEALERLHTWW